MPDGTSPDVGEIGKNIVVFTPEQRKNLERSGYVIYRLTGQTLASMHKGVESEYRISPPWPRSWGNLGEQSSMNAEVAINPKALFLPKSDDKTFKEQTELMEAFSKKISTKFPGLKAIFGSVPDYVDLAFQHYKATGIRLFGYPEVLSPKTDLSHHTRTTSPDGYNKNIPHYATVGAFEEFQGIDVGGRLINFREPGLSVAPLIVSAQVVSHELPKL